MKLTKTKLKQIIKEELEGSSRDDAIASLKSLSDVFEKIAQANESGGAKWPYVPGKIVSPANSSAAWMTMAEDIEDEYYDELQHAIDMLEDKEGTNPHGSRTVEHAHTIGHPMADELAAAMTRAVDVALPYMKSLVGSGSGMTENKMKLSKTKLQQIIKEEIENILEESDAAVTEFELYSDLLEITKQLGEFNSKLNVSMGLTAAATKQSQLSDEVYEMIRRAIRGLDDARIKMAQAIGQDPAPELAPVR